MPNRARKIKLTEESCRLANDASRRKGQSVEQYISDLIISDDEESKLMSPIILSEEKYERFEKICSKKSPLSDKVRAIARDLDENGY